MPGLAQRPSSLTADMNASNNQDVIAQTESANGGSVQRLVSLRQTLSWVNQSLRHPRMDYHQQMMEVCQRISTVNTMELRESLDEAITALKQANNVIADRGAKTERVTD